MCICITHSQRQIDFKNEKKNWESGVRLPLNNLSSMSEIYKYFRLF